MATAIDCPDRRKMGGTGDACCARAARLLDTEVGGEFAVSLTTCQACLRSQRLASPRHLRDCITSEVASLAYRAARLRLQSHSDSDAEGTVRLWESVRFAEQHLRVGPVQCGTTAADGSAEAPRKSARGDGPSICSGSRTAAQMSVRRLAAWRQTGRADSGTPKIGVIGLNSRQGLGTLTRSLVEHLPIERWLTPEDQSEMRHCDLGTTLLQRLPLRASDRLLEGWIAGLDCLIFAETPLFPRVLDVARRLSVKVLCIPMWEWIHPGLSWLEAVDTMVCPTRHCLQLMLRWKRAFGFPWNVEHVDWPIDLRPFRFRLRKRCRRFVFVNGMGGASAETLRGNVRRKGVELIAEVSRRAPDLPFRIYSQTRSLPRFSPQTQIVTGQAAPAALYRRGDVCVQPSYWEGLGLQLLECQAAGMPLVTSDAAPMNEHNPLQCIPVRDVQVGRMAGERHLTVPHMEVSDVVETLRALQGQCIATESWNARQFVESRHSWQTAAVRLNAIVHHTCGSESGIC